MSKSSQKHTRKGGLSSEFMVMLSRDYAGQWVAVQEDTVVASDSTLSGLLKGLGDVVVTVLWVPVAEDVVFESIEGEGL